MINLIKSTDRGYFNHGWLDTYHTFSFGQYHNPKQMAYGHLRVINEDMIQPQAGFPLHPHRDMEIMTYVMSGSLTHTDSMGHEETIREGMVQVMTAGTGIYHSEFNNDPVDSVHLLQVWILPKQKGLTPRYDQMTFFKEDRINKWCRIVSPIQRLNSLMIYQDINVYIAYLEKGKSLAFDNPHMRKRWIQVISGQFHVNQLMAEKGDGIAFDDHGSLEVTANESGELLLFDIQNSGLKH